VPATNAAQILRKSGVVLIGAALLSAEAAWLHMRSLAHGYGEICGSRAGILAHCPACYASAALFVSAVAAFIRAPPDRSSVNPIPRRFSRNVRWDGEVMSPAWRAGASNQAGWDSANRRQCSR
jgi:hypothetical protein